MQAKKISLKSLLYIGLLVIIIVVIVLIPQVMRETELLYLTGPQIKSYRLILINAKGEEMSSERVFLDPSLPSQNLSVPAPAKIDNDTTNDLIQSKINTFGLRLISINVLTNEIVRENTKLVILRLTADSPDPDASINVFIPTLRPFLKDINTTYAAQISLLHLFIIDAQGNLAVEYILDLDTETEAWSLSNDIEVKWFPRPAPTQSPLATPSPVKPIPTQSILITPQSP